MDQELTMKNLSSKIVPIVHGSDVGVARRAARHLATTMGFSPIASEEIVLAVSELGTNLVKYTHGGELTITPLSANGRVGIAIEAVDQGLGITNLDLALTDGFSTSGSLGDGLGAVNRFMDEFDVKTSPGYGTRILCRKWIREHTPPTGLCPLDIGVATRPCLSETINGDAFVVKSWGQCVLVGIIDGLGHGQYAHHAAQTAREYVEMHFDLPLVQLFSGVDRSCRGTRGVVMALVRFEYERACIISASVGNIDARVYPSSRTNYFEVRRGIIGLNAPKPIVKENAWPIENILVLYSDGLRTHWSWDDFPEFLKHSASENALTMLRTQARDDDDATIVVVRSAQL